MASAALERLGKWRALLAGWQLGTRAKGDPECDAVRDTRELLLLLRDFQDMPRRRYVFLGKVEGDTRRDLAGALRHLAFEVEAEKLGRSSICGGPSNSHIASLTEDEAVTHDSYFAAIEAELAKKQADADG